MKPIPIVLLLAAVAAPAALRAQDAPAPPPIDPADTLKAVEMSAVAQRAYSPDDYVINPVVAARYPPALRAAGVGGTVLVRLVVDARGRAVAPRVAETSGHPELDAAALRVVEELRYTPALHGGGPHPVWANFSVRFRPPGRDWVERVSADQVRAWADSTGALAPWQVDGQPHLPGGRGWGRVMQEAYLPSLRDAGVRGTAAVWFVVNTQGRPAAARLARSSGHPELDRAALGAVETLRFVPASRAGRPVDAWRVEELAFDPPASIANRLLPEEGTYELSVVEEMPEISNRAQVARLIPQLYPPTLRALGVTGEVWVRMLIDARGVPGEIVVVESTSPEFAAAAVRLVEQMRFSPGKIGGKPVRVSLTLPLRFQVSAPAPAAPRRP